MKVAQARRIWWLSSIGYTLAGTASAALTGAALGFVGRLAGARPGGGPALYALALFALLLAAREWRLLSFPLPRPLRQTEKFWAHDFGMVTAASMWGFHIGLGFVTQVRHGGFWALAAAGVAFGDPGYGALLLVAYWTGRALSVWIAPLVLTPEGLEPEHMTDLVRLDADTHRHFQAATLLWSAAVAAGLGEMARSESALRGLASLLR